jgi:hypothetical protein
MTRIPSLFHIPMTGGVRVAETLYGTRAGRHTSVAQYQLAFGASEFYNYFKFTSVRNPWDRVYSAYRYLMSGAMGGQHDLDWIEFHLQGVGDFENFVTKFLPNVQAGTHFRSQESYLRSAITGRVCVDFLGRYERISEDFEVELPHLNKSKIDGRYRDAYSRRMKEIVGNVYERDARRFEYEF